MAPVRRSATARTEVRVDVAPNLGARAAKLNAQSLIMIQTLPLPPLPRRAQVQQKKGLINRLQGKQASIKKVSQKPALQIFDENNNEQSITSKEAQEPEDEEDEDIKYDIPQVPVQMALFSTLDDSTSELQHKDVAIKEEYGAEVQVSTTESSVDGAAAAVDVGITENSSTKKVQVCSENSEDEMETDDDDGDSDGQILENEEEESTLEAVEVEEPAETSMRVLLEPLPLGYPRYSSTPMRQLQEQALLNSRTKAGPSAVATHQLRSFVKEADAKVDEDSEEDYDMLELHAPDDFDDIMTF